MRAKKGMALIAGMCLIGANAYADDEIEFEAELTGDQEVPPVITEANGEAEFEVRSFWMIKD
jgi:hypothetical protein